MTVSLGSSLASDGIFYLFTCGRRSLDSGTQNEIVVSWISLWGMIKVYWLGLTLAYILDHAVCCASAASSGRSLHLIISQLSTKYTSSNCPNHVRRTQSSTEKRIILRRTVRSIFGKQTFAQLRTSFMSTEPVGLLGTGAQDVHLDFHTAPVLWALRTSTIVLRLLFTLGNHLEASVCQKMWNCLFREMRH